MHNDHALAVRLRPRLLYFQYRYDHRLPPFLLQHADEHVRCLSEFFDVTVVRDDCDYLEVCDRHRPDLVLFESGVNHRSCRKPRVLNVRRNACIPRVALHHADAFCDARAGFISDLEQWGIETAFAISTTAAEHTPELAAHLFYWPVFVDSAVFRDYGMTKTIPILVTGNSSALYPWRRGVFPRLAAHTVSLVCPHPGYDPSNSFSHVLFGDAYARTLNASWFVPTCGTVAGEAVRKHFEIPASKACLIAERTPALAAAGFEDMVNCIFADPGDVLDKIDWLLRNPDDLARIIASGHALAQARHTMGARGQIYEWFRLHQQLLPGQRIVQPNPFALPINADVTDVHAATMHVHSRGSHLQLLTQGDEQLLRGDFAAAEDAFRACTRLTPWMPEPRLRLALTRLEQGDLATAWRLIDAMTRYILVEYRAADPDPVEWATRLIALLCFGAVRMAGAEACRFRHLEHPHLTRARWLCFSLAGLPPLPASSSRIDHRPSIHVLPPRSLEEWLADVRRMLVACGQSALASAMLSLAGGLAPDVARRDGVGLRKRTRSLVGSARVRLLGLADDLDGSRRRLVAGPLQRAVRATRHRLGHYVSPFSLAMPPGAADSLSTQIARHLLCGRLLAGAFVGASSGPAAAAFFAACRAVQPYATMAELTLHVHAFKPKPIDDTAIDAWLRHEHHEAFDITFVEASCIAPRLDAVDMLLPLARRSTLLLIGSSDSKQGFLLQASLLRSGMFKLEAVDRSGYSIARLRREDCDLEVSTKVAQEG